MVGLLVEIHFQLCPGFSCSERWEGSRCFTCWVLAVWVFFKKDSMIELSNYKAVSLLCVPIKLVEMIIKLFVDVCHIFNLIASQQHGSLVSPVDCLSVV